MIAFVGDGALLFNPQELATMARHHLKLTVVIANDSSYSAIRYSMLDEYGRASEAHALANPDFVELGRSFGMDAVRLPSCDELWPALERARKSSRSNLIEIPLGARLPTRSLRPMSRIDPEVARQQTAAALRSWGATRAVAACVADHLVDADRSGHPSHGLRQLLRYRAQAASGELDLTREPSVLHRSGIATTIDAAGGLGHPALALAIDCAAEAATTAGAGMSAVVRCGHAGRLGAWVERGARQGMLSLVALASAEPPFWMAAAPGAAPALQCNPIAIGAPSNGSPFVLDIATSVVAEGKVWIKRDRAEPLAPGIILGPDRQPSTDPDALYDGGAMLPFGGHKGFGLAVMVEVLSIALTGADADGLIPASGALVICLREDVFRPALDVRSSLERLRARINASGHEIDVLVPGDFEEITRGASHSIDVEDDVLRILEEHESTSA